MNAIITRGVNIGDNVVIDVGSVIAKDCESDSVYAGCPARKIMTIQQFREKRRQKQFEEAKEIALEYRDRVGENPPKEVFCEYFMLFCTAEEASRIPAFRRQVETGNTYDETYCYMHEHSPMFKNYQAFLEACFA